MYSRKAGLVAENGYFMPARVDGSAARYARIRSSEATCLVAHGHNGLAVHLEFATEPWQRLLRQLAPARTSEVALPALAGQPSLLAPEIRRSCPATSHGAGTGVAHPFRRDARPAVRVLICAAFHTVRVGVPDTLCNSYG